MSRWDAGRAADWYARAGWICGFNYLPRTAVNWTEQWQEETFDPGTIEQELGWAQEIGFNSLRTNLQYLVWEHDAAGLVARLDRFLGIAAARGLRAMLCLFDDCGFSGEEPHLGAQGEPHPGVHNGRAAASPGRARVRDRSCWPRLEAFVADVVGHFRDDPRVLCWDLYNEPGNDFVFAPAGAPGAGRDAPLPATEVQAGGGDLLAHSHALLERCFARARSVAPAQPLTAGVWTDLSAALNATCVGSSDVLTFHAYGELASVQRQVAELREPGRPILCTEWLARQIGSRVETHLPWFRRERIGCFHWGLVKGRTQTHLPWPPLMSLARERPGLWFHDLLDERGRPHDAAEVELFRRLARDAAAPVPSALPSPTEA